MTEEKPPTRAAKIFAAVATAFVIAALGAITGVAVVKLIIWMVNL